MNNVLRKATASILLLVLLMTASACRSTEIIVEKNEEADLDEKFCSLLLQEKKEVVTALSLSDSQVKKYDSASFHYLVNDYQEEIEGEYFSLALTFSVIDSETLKTVQSAAPTVDYSVLPKGEANDLYLQKASFYHDFEGSNALSEACSLMEQLVLKANDTYGEPLSGPYLEHTRLCSVDDPEAEMEKYTQDAQNGGTRYGGLIEVWDVKDSNENDGVYTRLAIGICPLFNENGEHTGYKVLYSFRFTLEEKGF